jgi:hypothetical protein
MKKIADVPTLTLCAIVTIVLPVALRAAQATGLPPDPNNAALLYYQAFLLWSEADDATLISVREFMDGGLPDSEVRTYLKLREECIGLATAATEIAGCDWGMWYSRGFGGVPLLSAQRTAHLLRLKGLVLAADGRYRDGLSACLAMRRMAMHIGDATPLDYLCALGEDLKALHSIERILEAMAPDTEDLIWLNGRLQASAPSLSLSRPLSVNLELVMQMVRTNDAVRARIRDKVVARATDDGSKARLERLTIEELLARVREPYARYLQEALKVIASDAAYGQIYAELQRLTKALNLEYGQDPAANYVIRLCARPAIPDVYATTVRHAAAFNAVVGAVNVLLAKARTGQFPKMLPDGLPRDPYSGKDFEYTLADDGFVLRSRVPDLRSGKPYEFEFRPHK